MKIRTTLATIVICALMVIATDASACVLIPKLHRVPTRFTVRVLTDGVPVPGALIEIDPKINKTLHTNREGYANIVAVPGEYSVWIKRSGFTEFYQLEIVNEPLPKLLTLDWAESTATVRRFSGTVTHLAKTEELAVGTKLSITDVMNDHTVFATQTDSKGNFDAPQLQSGIYIVSFAFRDSGSEVNASVPLKVSSSASSGRQRVALMVTDCGPMASIVSGEKIAK